MNLDQKIERVKELLHQIENAYAPAALANSLGAEDMVLTDLIARHAPAIEIFSLDTGRLPEETYRLLQEIRDCYAVPITVYFPEARAVEQYALAQGPNAFYASVELRKLCCHIRKVEPLRRALDDKHAWITGLRREQAPTRKNLEETEWDADNGLRKFNPLIEWSQADVWSYIYEFRVPYNVLHDKSYPSIGCAPCTRAVTAEEDVRAGRWWWEDPLGKECGLHQGKEKVT